MSWGPRMFQVGALGRACAMVAAAAILTAAAAGPALAVDPGEPAEPPPANLEGVVFDASLTVTFREYDGVGGAAIAGAAVHVTASRDGLPIAAADGMTDELGQATFEGLPRATDGTPVLLAVLATIEGPEAGPCGGTWFKSAYVDGVESSLGGVLDLPPPLQGGNSGECLPDLEGVVFDGQLTIVAVDPEGAALPGRQVYVDAIRDDDESIWVDARTTDTDGRATFSGLPRPEPGGPSITWHAFGSFHYDVVDGCTVLVVADGSVDVPAGATPVESELTLDHVRYGEDCGDPAPGSPILSGVVVDAAGAPVPGSSFAMGSGTLGVRQVRVDGGIWAGETVVGEDGAFSVMVQPWGTSEIPSQITVSVLGPETRVEVDDQGCRLQYALIGSLTIDAPLAEDPVLAPVEVVLAEGLVQAVCAETEGPSAGGSPTLPPTDLGPAIDRGVANVAPACIVLMAMALGLVAMIVVPGRRRRA